MLNNAAQSPPVLTRSTTTLRVPALDCPEELGLIERGLQRVAGVGPLAPNYMQRTLRVEFDPARVSADQIVSEVNRIGFSAETADAETKPVDGWTRPRLRRTTLLGGGLLLIAAAAYFAAAPSMLVAALAVLSTLISGMPVARAALRAVRLRALDMNVLMTVAGTGAIATGEFFEAATAMFLFGVSLWLESFSLGRARRAVHALIELSPEVAHRLSQRDATAIEDVAPDELGVDDLVLVRPGERAPIDGLVVSGASAVDQAPITGESIPVDKSAGDRVFAGTLNGEGSLTVRVTHLARDSTLAAVGRLVEQASAARSPTERFVDAFARRYTPAVIGLAVLLAVLPPLLATWGVAWAAAASSWQWFHRALVLLVIACPCALVISTPVTIVCGLYRGARRGMLIKGGEHLENAARIHSLAIDKTGTLTSGAARVVAIEPSDVRTVDEVLQLAASLEQHSEHPLAAAILAAAAERGLSIPDAENFSALRGFGIEGTIGGRRYFVGSPRLFEQNGAASLEDSPHAGEGATPAILICEQQLLGTIWLADALRDDARRAIDELRALDVAPIALLTGDRRAVAAHIAQQVGIDEIYADLLPEDKVATVQLLTASRPQLAMVGDGVNDAPALAASRLGIAFGSQASATALETADVVVMSPQLARLPELIRLGRRTRRILKQNITLALLVKALVLILAALGWATMWMAVAADVGASLVVIANGMRLLGGRDEG